MYCLLSLVLFCFISESYSQVFLNNRAFPNQSICGINPTTNKIYGGNETALDEYPWLAAIEYQDKYDGGRKIKCGGSLVTKRHIITAAHCIKSPHTLVRAWLGDWKITTDPDCQTIEGFRLCNDKVQKIDILLGISHPRYNGTTIKNDVGVIFLKNDAVFTGFVKPICLPSPTLLNPPRTTTLYATGWGLTEHGKASDIKLKVELPLKRNSECNLALLENLDYEQLCVGGEAGKDTCGGDSGGPLMHYYINNRTHEQNWYLLGIVSYGYDCGDVGMPAVYTRVPSYVNWIVQTITTA